MGILFDLDDLSPRRRKGFPFTIYHLGHVGSDGVRRRGGGGLPRCRRGVPPPGPGGHRPGAAPLRSAGTGVALAIVSNSDGTLEERLCREGICQVGPGAGVPMAIVIDSDAVGVAKPDPAIFHLAMEATGIAPDRALHVGDTVGADVEG